VDYLGQFGIQGGRPAGPDQTARLRSIAPHYFSVMRIPVLRGRTFTDRDSAQAPKVAIISDACARQYFPGIDPIGHRVDAGYSDDPREIVGVVADVHLTQVREGGAEPTIYMPLSQETGAVTWLVARAASPAALAGPIRQAVREIDPALPVELVTTMDHVVSESIADARFYAMSLGGLACVALLLAAIGIYGVVSYSVGQRLTEIGIRLALGASRPAVFRTVLGHVAWLVAVGVAIGVAGAWALGRLVASFLFEVRPRDPWTLAAVTATLSLVAVLAACLPARRATRVDPITVLRCE
jgi:putative ABC transport system permease protein